jgi:HEAT repeat protein
MISLPDFAVNFAHLVWLFSTKPHEVEEQRQALHRCMNELGQLSRSVILHDISQQLVANFRSGQVTEESTWLAELAHRMSAHSVRSLVFEAAAMPHEVLTVAELLCTQAVPGDDGAAFDAKFAALSSPNVAAELGELGFVRRATPVAAAAAVGATAYPKVGTTADGGRDGGELPAALGSAPGDGSSPEQRPQGQTPDSRTTAQQMLVQAVADQAHPEALQRRLEGLIRATPEVAGELLANVAQALELCVANQRWDEVVQGLDALGQWAEGLADDALKRSARLVLRRLARPLVLVELARLLPQRRDLREAVTRILVAAGEAGADVLIAELVQAQKASQRKAYLAALARCQAAVPTLIQLLEDERWYVVRNAVELLGELGEPGIEGQVAKALAHKDPRVRRAAAGALGKLATPRAVVALLGILGDPVPEVRLQTVLALAAVKDLRAVPWLIEALAKETDATVRVAMVRTLGKLPSEDAVTTLADEAQPGGPLRRKSAERRIPAVEALAEAGTERALAALKELADDRDAAVRAAVARALGG